MIDGRPKSFGAGIEGCDRATSWSYAPRKCLITSFLGGEIKTKRWWPDELCGGIRESAELTAKLGARTRVAKAVRFRGSLWHVDSVMLHSDGSLGLIQVMFPPP